MDATRMAAAQRVANELRADGRNRDGGGTADPQNNHRIMRLILTVPEIIGGRQGYEDTT